MTTTMQDALAGCAEVRRIAERLIQVADDAARQARSSLSERELGTLDRILDETVEAMTDAGAVLELAVNDPEALVRLERSTDSQDCEDPEEAEAEALPNLCGEPPELEEQAEEEAAALKREVRDVLDDLDGIALEADRKGLPSDRGQTVPVPLSLVRHARVLRQRLGPAGEVEDRPPTGYSAAELDREDIAILGPGSWSSEGLVPRACRCGKAGWAPMTAKRWSCRACAADRKDGGS